MKENLKFNVVEDAKKSEADFKRRVGYACKHARRLKIDPVTGLDPDLVAEALKFKRLMEEKEILSFEFEELPNRVLVENTHQYLTLIRLSLRQMLKANFHLSEKELDSPEYQEQYAEWYQSNTERHFEHELEHYLGALEHTNLKCKLGVEFMKSKEHGINFNPLIDFEGTVPSVIFRKYVLMGPRKLSKLDRVMVE